MAVHTKQELNVTQMIKEIVQSLSVASLPVCDCSPSVVPMHFQSALKHESYVYTSYFEMIFTVSTCIILELKGESQLEASVNENQQNNPLPSCLSNTIRMKLCNP